MFGIFSSLGFAPIPFLANKGPNYKPSMHSDTEEESEAEDVDEDILDHAPNWSNALAQDEKDGLRFRGGKGKENGNWNGNKEGEKEVKKEKKEKKVEKKDEVKSVQKGEARAAETGEECKLVLVVRTDLGMTKGMYSNLYSIPTYITTPQNPTNFSKPRQNRRPSLPRNPSMLQKSPQINVRSLSPFHPLPSSYFPQNQTKPN